MKGGIGASLICQSFKSQPHHLINHIYCQTPTQPQPFTIYYHLITIMISGCTLESFCCHLSRIARSFHVQFQIIFSCAATQYVLLCVCLWVVCPRFLIWNGSVFEYLEYSRIFKDKQRFHIKSWEHTTDNKQTHKCKKLKLLPTPTMVSYQLTKMTGSKDTY